MLIVLRRRNFLLLWLSGFISLMGDWMLNIALPIYLYLLTHSVLAIGAVLVAEQIPTFIMGSFAGVLVDRWNRRATLIGVNVILAMGLLPLLLVTSADRIWIAYIVAFVESSLAQFVRPAVNAFLPEIVPTESLAPANSLTAFAQQAARLVGPALGGLVFAYGGLRGVIVGDAISFILPALLLRATSVVARPRPHVERAERKRGAGLREWRDGLRVIRHSRALSVLLSTTALTTIGEGVFGTLLVVYVNRALHGGAREFGWLMSAQAIGGIIGGLVTGPLGNRLTSRWSLGIASILFGAIDLVIFNIPAYFPSVLLVAGLFVLVGIPGMAISVGIQTGVQQATPEAYLGRVFGTLYSVLAIMYLLGVGVASGLTDKLGVITLLNIQGGGYVVAGILIMLLLAPVSVGALAELRANRHDAV